MSRSSSGKRKVRRIELHEVKTLNKHLARLRDEFGLRAEVLLAHEVTGDDPPPRFNPQPGRRGPSLARPPGPGVDGAQDR